MKREWWNSFTKSGKVYVTKYSKLLRECLFRGYSQYNYVHGYGEDFDFRENRLLAILAFLYLVGSSTC